MAHLFRPADPPHDDLSPSWKAWRGLLVVALWRILNCFARAIRSHQLRRYLAYCVVLVGLVGQVVLLLVASYLVDLSVSLMELWADLARKHLEITL